MSQTDLHQAYVLQNTNGIFYIGLSENMYDRLKQHNTGVSKWTRSRGPWALVWTSETMSLSRARKLENLLKRQIAGSASPQREG